MTMFSFLLATRTMTKKVLPRRPREARPEPVLLTMLDGSEEEVRRLVERVSAICTNVNSEKEGSYVFRSRRRKTKRRPDQVSSMAQTLLSTRPEARPTSRTTSSVRSVGTPDARLGHATQSPPDVWSCPAALANSATRVSRELMKRRITSYVSAPNSEATLTPSGIGASDASSEAGAERSARRASGFRPSFFDRGVPEYPAINLTSEGESRGRDFRFRETEFWRDHFSRTFPSQRSRRDSRICILRSRPHLARLGTY